MRAGRNNADVIGCDRAVVFNDNTEACIRSIAVSVDYSGLKETIDSFAHEVVGQSVAEADLTIGEIDGGDR